MTQILIYTKPPMGWFYLQSDQVGGFNVKVAVYSPPPRSGTTQQ
ncbi:hypothetical protein RchiOBHm_Chr7g0187041 [Rosa chinensis]|uniref:Uncharacterized protein n=1 Tax=Rosa chinensis TaxID=74649 RepID=A0A2P6P449_ROSCH|nr:hypothetical protein RchiOBHm_Chr7g0187041 [Rosa chinensis]